MWSTGGGSGSVPDITSKSNGEQEHESRIELHDSVARDDDGATMVEYGLMVALIAVVCIAAVTLVGTSLSTLVRWGRDQH